MSGLETLPPDQRAVLQLILQQGRGYDELAGLLKIDAAAVRARAHAGLDALGGTAGGLAAGERARVADYLLGQQDEGERIVTLAELGASPAACGWARQLRDRLAPLARHALPELPTPAGATNGAPVTAAPPAAEPPPTPEPPPPPPQAATPTPARARQPVAVSRLGGALLLVAVAALIVVGLIVLIDDDHPMRAAGPGTTPAATQPSTTGQPSAQPIAQVNLDATPAGGRAVGFGVAQRIDGTLALAVQAQRLPANGAQDFYAVWIKGPPGARFLGFVPNQVKANGTFSVGAELPRNARRYDTVLITRESTAGEDAPTTPGEAILSGTLDLP